jgi:serine/threonine-protein kinase
MQTAALSEDGRVMGNAHYVSPEQAVGEPLDARSDIYSLGVCGFYALSGRLPFDAETPEEIVTQHLTRPAPPVSRFAHTVPTRLGQAVDKCLAKDPADRYRNAEAFADAIDLAFEHAKEIPIALRVWIQQGEKEAGPRAMLVLWGGVLGSLIAVVNMSPWLFPLTVLGATAVSFFPVFTRLRRVLKDGYVVDDLHAALREHDLLRSEELQYERRFSLAGLSPALRVMLVASISSMGALSWLVQHSLSFVGRNVPAADANFFRTTFTFAAVFAVGSTVGLAGQFLKQRLTGRIAEIKVNFWKGPWGARLAKLAGIGLDVSDRPTLGVRMLTEVALGRATDHLYQALPKAVRRELADLPETIRRLEQDATKLRASIDSLDDHLAVYERSRMRDTSRPERSDSSRPERSEGPALHASNLESELREARALAAERLAATVSALESIRLDLLRLQMGSGGIESVTASLAAAQRVGEQIGLAIESQAEVERFLASPQPRVIQEISDEIQLNEDDDADTPVQGVPATRG